MKALVALVLSRAFRHAAATVHGTPHCLTLATITPVKADFTQVNLLSYYPQGQYWAGRAPPPNNGNYQYGRR